MNQPAPTNSLSPTWIGLKSGAFHAPNGHLYLSYKGQSMRPTLHESDMLEIIPYDGRAIQRGEVIVFLPAMGAEYVVHRVVNVVDGGITTRGDNNACLDPWIISPSRVVGKVQAAWRGQRRIRMLAGYAGRAWSFWLSIARKLDRMIAPKLHPLYRLISGKVWFLKLLPEHLQPQVFLTTSGGRSMVKVIIGSRVVGWYDEIFNLWRIRRPYRLFVAEDQLAGIRNRESGEEASPSAY